MSIVDEIIKIKQILISSCYSANKTEIKRCGCYDVKVHLPGNDMVMDFMTYDSNIDAVGCYTIKTTLSDLFSINSKSFCGNYNYLVITQDMWKAIKEDKSYFDNLIPDFVGIVICDAENKTTFCLRYTKRQALGAYSHTALKDSLIYALFSKWQSTEKKYQVALQLNNNSTLSEQELDIAITNVI